MNVPIRLFHCGCCTTSNHQATASGAAADDHGARPPGLAPWRQRSAPKVQASRCMIQVPSRTVGCTGLAGPSRVLADGDGAGAAHNAAHGAGVDAEQQPHAARLQQAQVRQRRRLPQRHLPPIHAHLHTACACNFEACAFRRHPSSREQGFCRLGGWFSAAFVHPWALPAV